MIYEHETSWSCMDGCSGATSSFGGARALVLFSYLGAEEEARPVVRVVEQLELELVALDPPHRQRQLVLTLGGAARALVVPLGKLLALGGVLGLDALEPVERLEVGVLREQVRVGG